jgi:hypothetical protein
VTLIDGMGLCPPGRKGAGSVNIRRDDAALDHLRANVAAAEKGPLPPDVYERAKERLRS